MTNSILTSTKKVLQLADDYTAYDEDIMMHINSAFSILHQNGIGPSNGFAIYGSTEVWSDFLGDDNLPLNDVKSYVFLFVKLIFDPPASAYGTAAQERQLDELIWRINVRREEEEHPWVEPVTISSLLSE